MNICTRRQILLWDVGRRKNCSLVMKVTVKGFRLLRPVARKSGCRVRIVRKKGVPFLFSRYRKRKAFAVGAVLFIALVYLMTSFVWSVEITGNEKLETPYLESMLALYGIKPGVLKYGIDVRKTVADIMLDIEELSWISIDVKGTKVKVQLRERIIPPEVVPRDEPCNIVAVKEGMVSQIVVTDGIEAAVPGDTVKKGDILISGRIPVKNEKDKFRLVHAMGIVKARTWYEEEYPVIQEIEEKVATGREYTDYSLVLFANRIDLFHRKDKFRHYESTEDRKKLSVGENLVFPFELVEMKYSEMELVTKKISDEEAKRTAEENAMKLILEQKPEGAEVVKTDIKLKDDELLGLKVVITMECIEEIGMEQAMGGN